MARLGRAQPFLTLTQRFVILPVSTTVFPDTATGTGAAPDLLILVVAAVSVAAGTGAALDPNGGIPAQPALGTGTALTPVPGVVTGTQSSSDGVIEIVVNAPTAMGVGGANDPTLSIGSGSALAGISLGSGTALAPTPNITVIAGIALGVGGTLDPFILNPQTTVHAGIALGSGSTPRAHLGFVVTGIGRIRVTYRNETRIRYEEADA